MLNIKNPEAHRLARGLADLEQTTMTGTVVHALQMALDEHRRSHQERRRVLNGLISSARDIKISAATIAEAAVVIDARRPGAFDIFHRTLNLTVIPVDYALARQIDEPVLFTGDDFAHTDVASAMTSD